MISRFYIIPQFPERLNLVYKPYCFSKLTLDHGGVKIYFIPMITLKGILRRNIEHFLKKSI